jgi:hypothetical protein
MVFKENRRLVSQDSGFHGDDVSTDGGLSCASHVAYSFFHKSTQRINLEGRH